uniref:BESS domain-containing protein n=1 Tax=Gongylonema pulchrum TaxID=637853 RepID=A0A183EHU3_9BILA
LAFYLSNFFFCRDLNQSLEKLKLSFKKKFTYYGQQVDKTDDELTSNENTYVEDSFCVKDSFSEEVNQILIIVTSSSAWSEEKSLSENPENISIPKGSEKASAKTADYSTYFKSDFLDEGDADAKISALLELYPELKENADPARKKQNGPEKAPKSSSSDEDDCDEKFEKCTFSAVFIISFDEFIATKDS